MHTAEVITFPDRPDPALAPLSNIQSADIIALPSKCNQEFRAAINEELAELRFTQSIAPTLEHLGSDPSEGATELLQLIYQRYLQYATEYGIGPALDHTLNQIDLMKAHPATRQLLMPPRRQP